MSRKLKLLRSTVKGKVPTPEQIDIGELAVNTADRTLYSKHGDGSVVVMGISPDSIDTLTNKTLESPVITGQTKRNIEILTDGVINCSVSDYFIALVDENTTFSFTNVPSAVFTEKVLRVSYDSGTVTWPASVVWLNPAPTFISGNEYFIRLMSDDGGFTWYAVLMG